jgi:chromosome segregation ATPase
MSDKAQRNHDAKLKQVTELSEPLKSIEDDMKDFQEKRKAEQRKQRERVEEKRKLRERVASDTQKLGNKPDVQEDVERITAEIVASNEASRDAKLEFDRLTRKIQELQDHVKRNDDQRGNKMGQLKKLSDVRTQRLNALRSINVDAAEAAEWLAKNQDKFDHPVAGPLFLDVEITDPKHKIAAGYTLQKHASMFVCASKKDYRTFNQLLVDGNAAGRPLRLQVSEYSETKAPTIQHHNQPLPSSALTQYGFDCYVLDCISGPDLLLNALCHVAKIHRLPVASQPLSPAKEQQVQDVKVQGQWVFDSYICGNYETRLLRRYNKFQTSSERIKEERTKWHSGGSGDVDVRSKMLEHEVLELTEAIDEASTSIDEMQPRHAMLKEKLQATSRKKSALASERDKYASHVKDWKKLNERLERARKNLEALENAPDTYQQILAEIKAQQRQAAEEAVTCALAVQVVYSLLGLD